MTPERHRRAMELFDEACDLPAEKRPSFLHQSCDTDVELREHVERLLRHDEQVGDFVQQAEAICGPGFIATGMAALDSTTVEPRRIGRYAIVRKIGEGGMGVVYEAMQETPKRAVALKLLRPGFTSRALLRRFEFEAEVLGRLKHPGIAQIYEAGTAESPTGVQPYFAMEFVRGSGLLDYAEKLVLRVSDRLALFAKVCDAVQFAHQVGVIHRDLKPGNILVDESEGSSGEPKILDFGVARATDADIRTVTMQTNVGQLVGTVPYMSPEQVTGDPNAVDTRSDVYALGVILFELLGRRLPYNLVRCTIPEAVRVIRDDEPTRLGSLDAALRGDVETIVSKALEKNKDRRYGSAADLAADIRRFLANQPIVARPATTWYQLRKFAARNRGLVGGAATTALAVVLGAVVVLIFALRESQQRRLAELHAESETRAAYRSAIFAAAAAIRESDAVEARRWLEPLPEHLRGWEWRHLWGRLDESSVVLQLEPNRWASLAFDRTGKFLHAVLSPWSSSPSVWYRFDWSTKSLLKMREWPTRRQLNITPSASWLVYGQEQTTWMEPIPDDEDTGAGDLQAPLRYDDPTATVLAGRADGSLWLMKTLDSIFMWNAANNAVVHLHSIPYLSLTAGAFSRDGTTAAYTTETPGSQWAIRILDVESCVRTQELLGHSAGISKLTFHPDDRHLASASDDHTVCIWDLDRPEAPPQTLAGHSDRVSAVAYSPDGRLLASASGDTTVRVWDSGNGKSVRTLIGHDAGPQALTFHPSGKHLASVDQLGVVRSWDIDPVDDPRVLRGHTSYVYPIAVSPDGFRVVSGGWDGSIRFWDIETGDPIAVLSDPSTDGSVVRSLAYNSDGSLIAASVYDSRDMRNIRMIDARSGTPVLTVSDSLRAWELCFHPHRPCLLAYGTKEPRDDQPTINGISVRSVETLNELKWLPISPAPYAGPMGGFCCSPDGRWIAACGPEGTVALFDGETYERKATLVGHTESVLGLAFSPNANRLASSGADGTVRLWELSKFTQIAVLPGHRERVYALSYSPDGLRLASGGDDRTIRLWDTETNAEVVQLRGHTRYIWSLAWTPDGTVLLSGSGDHTIRIWETAPLRVRLAAAGVRRGMLESLRPEVAPYLDADYEPSDVVVIIQQNPRLGNREREVALQIVMSESARLPVK